MGQNQGFQLWVESRTPIVGTLRHNLREFLFGNFQIGFKNQELLYKASCMKPNPISFPKQEFRFENEGERDFEKKRTDQIPYTNLCSLFDVTLSIRASLFFSSFCLCYVCVIALFLYFRLSLLFFSFFRVSSLYLQRDSKGIVPLFFSQLIRSWSSFRQFFLHNS